MLDMLEISVFIIMSGVSLLNFMIVNPSLASSHDDENNKILYYFPPEADIDTQLRNVGRVEALIKFTGTFQPNGPLNCLHTQKTRQYFLEPEPNFWMIMTISVPITPLDDGTMVPMTPLDDGTMGYLSDVLNDNVYQAILLQCYQMFRLFMNTFASTMNVKDSVIDVRPLKTRLNQFFPKYLATVQLNSADISDAFQGIQFFPMDKLAFSKVHSLVNAIENEFPFVSHSVVLYQEQLIWSALAKSDMQIFYQYLVTSLLPSQRGSASSNFLTGPPHLNEDNLGKVPRVFLQDTTLEEAFVVVYKLNGICLALFIEVTVLIYVMPKVKIIPNTCSVFLLLYSYIVFFLVYLYAYLSSRLTHLAADLQEQQRPNSCTSFRFLYFNRLNLSGRSTLHFAGLNGKKNSVLSSVPDYMNTIADLSADAERHGHGETIVKTSSDCWIMSRIADQRELFVVLNQKKANLTDVHEEVRRLCSTNFNNIFYVE
nr:EOG090X084E [Triops cancriformis]